MTTKVSDTFTETSNTGLASHTPDLDVEGGGWTVIVNTTGTATVIGADDNLHIDTVSVFGRIDLGLSGDMVVEVDYDAGGSDNRITVNVKQDADAGYGDRDCYAFNVRPATADAYLIEVNAGFGTSIDSATGLSIDENTPLTIRLEYTTATGAIEGYIDDVLVCSGTDTTHDALTRAGLLQNLHTDSNGRFDNFIGRDFATAAGDASRLLLMGVG